MKIKKRIIMIICISLLGILLAGCFGRYKITVTGDKTMIDQYPKYAKPGETVTVTTVVVCDGIFNFHCSTDYTTIREGVYEFVMPDHDVEIGGSVTTVGVPGS